MLIGNSIFPDFPRKMSKIPRILRKHFTYQKRSVNIIFKTSFFQIRKSCYAAGLALFLIAVINYSKRSYVRLVFWLILPGLRCLGRYKLCAPAYSFMILVVPKCLVHFGYVSLDFQGSLLSHRILHNITHKSHFPTLRAKRVYPEIVPSNF